MGNRKLIILSALMTSRLLLTAGISFFHFQQRPDENTDPVDRFRPQENPCSGDSIFIFREMLAAGDIELSEYEFYCNRFLEWKEENCVDGSPPPPPCDNCDSSTVMDNDVRFEIKGNDWLCYSRSVIDSVNNAGELNFYIQNCQVLNGRCTRIDADQWLLRGDLEDKHLRGEGSNVIIRFVPGIRNIGGGYSSGTLPFDPQEKYRNGVIKIMNVQKRSLPFQAGLDVKITKPTQMLHFAII